MNPAPPAASRGPALLLGLAAAAIGLAWKAPGAVTPFLFAFILAYILDPAVVWLEKKKIRRGFTIKAALLLLVAGTVAGAVAGVPAALHQVRDLYGATFRGDEFAPDGKILRVDWNRNHRFDPPHSRRIIDALQERAERWNARHPEARIPVEDLAARLRENADRVGEHLLAGATAAAENVAGAVFATLSGAMAVLSWVFLVPLYVYFFLSEFPAIRAFLSEQVLPRGDTRGARVLKTIQETIGGFFRGKLLICLIKGLLTWFGLWIIGVKFSFLFGILQAASSLVPFLPLVAAWLPALVWALLDQGLHWGPAAGVTVVFVVAEAVEGAVLTPWLLGKRTGLHAVWVIFALVAGGELFGLVGALIAIPAAAVVRVLLSEYVWPVWLARRAAAPAEDKPRSLE